MFCFVRSSLSNQPNIMTEPIHFKYAPKQCQKYCESHAFVKVVLRPIACVVSVSQVRNIFFLSVFVHWNDLEVIVIAYHKWVVGISRDLLILCTYISLRYTLDITPLLQEESCAVFTPSRVGHVVGNRMKQLDDIMGKLATA